MTINDGVVPLGNVVREYLWQSSSLVSTHSLPTISESRFAMVDSSARPVITGRYIGQEWAIL